MSVVKYRDFPLDLDTDYLIALQAALARVAAIIASQQPNKKAVKTGRR